MADPTPTPTSQPKPPATATKPGDPEVEGSPLELLRQNAGTMIAILVAVVALVTVLTWRSGQSRKFELRAWSELAELKKQQPGEVKGFLEAAKKYAGTDADPYIRTAWAARLYESGERSKVERALELYKEVLKSYPDHPLFGQKGLLPGEVKKLEAELASPRANLYQAPTPPAQGGGTAPPTTLAPPANGG